MPDIDLTHFALLPAELFDCIGMVVAMEDTGDFGFFTDTGRYVFGGFATEDAATIARDTYFQTVVKH